MYEKYFKRVFDVIGASLILLILLLFMVIIVILIKFFDRGPIFFSQERVGLNGNPFVLYKFRTLPIGTGDIPSDKLGNIKKSCIGAVLRRTNIDELPQLLNIILGDMSLVGPRPCLKNQEALIQRRRENMSINCKPGLTGLAQIRAFNGMSIEQKAKLDQEYAESITFFGDLRIVAKTFLYLFRAQPVY